MAFSKNPLYPEFHKAVRQEARRQWQQSDANKMVKDVRHALNTPRRVGATANQFANMIQTYSRHGLSGGFFKQASRLPFQDMVREVVRYQASGGEGARLITQLLGALGPVGRIIASLIRPGSKVRSTSIDAEVDAATRFLQAFAPDKLTPELRTFTAGNVANSVESAISLLEEEGYEVTGPTPMRGPGSRPRLPRVTPRREEISPLSPDAPLRPGRIQPQRKAQPPEPRPASDDPVSSEEQIFYPTGIPKGTKGGTPRQVVDIQGRRFPATHPIVTKEMVRADSSNVYAFGYDVDSRTLYVRYRAAPRFGGGMGSLYAYDGVSMDKFLSLYESPSKGTWMWDNVRIRGTWSGHRHPYRLAAIRYDYVPRMATYAGGGRELFVPRTVQVHSKKRGFRTLTSQLPEEYAPSIVPMDGSPNRGEPNRGEPNRGR